MKVLFVCLGNICRSPMAEGVFKYLVEKENLENKIEIDSAGTAAYHVGNSPDTRMRDVAASHGILLTSKAREITPLDLRDFDYIIAMDQSNFDNILLLDKGETTAKVVMMREFDSDPEDGNVPDPYYGGLDGFEKVYQILMRSNLTFLEKIKQELKSPS